jgi:hypothetical protein
MSERFAVIFTCKRHIAHPFKEGPDAKVMTEAGTKAWLTESEGYWWGTTFSEYWPVNRTSIPRDVVTFGSEEEARRKFKKFKSGPWYVEHDGSEPTIVRLKQKFKQVPDGFEEVK